MRRHWLGTLVGLCMLGPAAPTWAVPMVIFGDATFVVADLRSESAAKWPRIVVDS